MSGAATTNTPVNPPDYAQLMGHPRPLWMLFMTEFWERFAFYGIRWALVLYIVAQFHGGADTGEAFLTGGAMALIVVYRPHWCSTFDDARYLRPR